jgi:WD40 repeat protein
MVNGWSFLGHQTKLLNKNGKPTQINNTINSVAMSPNGRYAITGGSDHVAYLWDTKTGQVIYKFRHANRVTQVALDDKGKFAFTADSQKQARVWDLSTGRAMSQLKYVNRQEVFSFARFSEDGRQLITGAPNQSLTLWDTNIGEKIQEWYVTPRKDTRPASAVVYSAAFIENETRLVSVSSAGLSEVWERKNDQ